MARGSFAALALVACAPPEAPPDAPFDIAEPILPTETGPAAPAITVVSTQAALTRDDWVVAERAARAHCDRQGAQFALLPATNAYTQVQYDDGTWTFVARCTSG